MSHNNERDRDRDRDPDFSLGTQIDIVTINGKPQAVLPPTRGNALKFEARAPYAEPDRDTRPSITPGLIPDDLTSGFQWAPWGRNDSLPSDIRHLVEQVPMAGQAIYRITQMMYGNGLAYYRNEELEDGPRVSRYHSPVIEQWLTRNRIGTHFIPAQFINYRLTMNAFSEMIFSNDRRQITNIFHKEAEFCRLSVQNETNFKIESLYYSPEFVDGRVPTLDKIRRVPLHQWYDEEDFLNNLAGFKFAWHSKFPTPGVTYYARPFWIGLFRKNGWINVSRRVPEVVSAMMNNQIILKYHVMIPESYFEIRYPEWNTFTQQQRNTIIDDLIDEINETLAGTDNAFASIATVFKQDHLSNQALGKIEIIAVDDKIKKDAWVPSSDRADAQIVQGLGLHPSQVGLAPEGGKMGAGSGSDQREAFNTQINVNTIDQQILLEPLNWIARYNARTDPEWDVTFFIDHTYHTTTNEQEDGMQRPDTNLVVE